jgi:hypothetical protein
MLKSMLVGLAWLGLASFHPCSTNPQPTNCGPLMMMQAVTPSFITLSHRSNFDQGLTSLMTHTPLLPCITQYTDTPLPLLHIQAGSAGGTRSTGLLVGFDRVSICCCSMSLSGRVMQQEGEEEEEESSTPHRCRCSDTMHHRCRAHNSTVPRAARWASQGQQSIQ